MPNPRETQRMLAEARAQALAKANKEASAEGRYREIARLESIKALFDTPGWGHLMEEFQHQKQGVLDLMAEETPLEDRQLQLLRAEYVYVTRLLSLDKSINERLNSLKAK